MLKSVAFLILWAFNLLFGWSHIQEDGVRVPAAVERIDVQVKNQKEQIVYCEPEKMSKILDCLRKMEFQGFAYEKPDQVKGGACKMTLHLSDGTQKEYQLRGGNYFARSDRPWQMVSSERVQELYALLHQISGDSLPELQRESLQSGQSGRTFICSS